MGSPARTPGVRKPLKYVDPNLPRTWFSRAFAAFSATRLGRFVSRATLVGDEAERERLWTLADQVFAPYAAYRRDAAKVNRTIPIVQLTARETDART